MIQGDVSAYFESGNNKRSIQTISYNPQDPGGKSYGKYQLAIRTGSLTRYLNWSKYKVKFDKANPGSKEFDTIWIQLCKDDPVGFEDDQHEFIYMTHFVPVKNYARELGFNTNNFALNEALFSIGVQHGGYKSIVKTAYLMRVKDKDSIENDINNLYKARNSYVDRIGLSSSIKNALHNRYTKECAMVQRVLTGLKNSESQPDQDNTLAENLNFQDIVLG